METYDVVIVGAGPAGLSAAIELSRYPKLNCLIIDKNDFLDVSTRSWSTFDSFLKKQGYLSSGVYKLNHILFRSLRKSEVKIDMGKDPIWVLDEQKFKELMLKKVKIKKAEKTEVKKIIKEYNRVFVHTNKGKLATKILLDASGDAGLCRERFGIKVTTKVYFKCRLYENCNFHSDIAPWGIALTKKKKNSAFIAGWVEPYSNSKVLLATEAYSHKPVSQALHRKVLNIFMKDPQFNKIFEGAKKVREWNATISLTPQERGAFDNILLVGDAGVQSRPFVVEGLRPAIEEGVVAAKVAAKAIRLKNYSYKVLREYEEKFIHNLKFHENQELASIFQMLFIELDDKEFDRFFAEINNLDKKTLLKVLRGELEISDLPKIYKAIHNVVPISELIHRLPKKYKHKFMQRVELYLKDEFEELIHKII
ncbi:MAG: lycopene cyclase family protein [archaeon]